MSAPLRHAAAIKPRQIEAFEAVVRLGTTTAAASELRISQPAISRLIRDFEATIGLTLFNRKGNRLTHTPAAIILFRETQRCFDGFRHILQCASDIRQGSIGGFRVVAMPALALEYLTQPIADLVKAKPGLSVLIHCELSQNIPPLIDSGQFDVGIGSVPLGASRVQLEPLPTLYSACVLPAGHPLSKANQIKLRALSDVPLLTAAGNSLLRTRFQMAMASVAGRANIRAETTTAATLLPLVRRGLGVAIVDPFTAKLCREPSLVVRPLDPPVPYEATVLLPSRNTRGEATATFLSSFKKLIEKDFQVKCT